MKLIVIPLISAPGIQRDGTFYNSKSCIDGQWCRWYQNLPRKVGGYTLIASGITHSDLYPSILKEITNTIFSVVQNDDTVDVYFGKPSTISYIDYDQNAQIIGTEQDRTPILSVPPYTDGGFIPSPNNSWTIDLVTVDQSTGTEQGSASYIVAHPALNLNNIANQTPSTVFYGTTFSNPTTRLTAIRWVDYEDNPDYPSVEAAYKLIPTAINGAPVQVSGGIVFINPILVVYGNNGVIYFSDPEITVIPNPNSEGGSNDITITPPGQINFSNTASLTNTKIVRCIPYRGSNTNAVGGNSPSMLVWSINTLLKANYVPAYTTGTGDNAITTPATFTTQTIQSGISILSAKSIVEYNQVIYWIGDNQFFYYNGIVNKLDNDFNSDYFFQNLNINKKSLVFGYANPRYDEIWWFYPVGDSMACIMYNVKGGFWFDSIIGRSAAHIPVTFERPLLASSELENLFNIGIDDSAYPIWVHEKGLNKVKGTAEFAIQSYFQTHLIDLFSNNPENNNLIKTRRIELDLIQYGAMTVSVYNFLRPRSNPIISGPYTFTSSDDAVDNITSQGGLVSFRFESNTAVSLPQDETEIQGGYYQMGKTLFDYTIGDERK